jgi:hypothetical protein
VPLLIKAQNVVAEETLQDDELINCFGCQKKQLRHNNTTENKE